MGGFAESRFLCGCLEATLAKINAEQSLSAEIYRPNDDGSVPLIQLCGVDLTGVIG
jgi:hypothetical protein